MDISVGQIIKLQPWTDLWMRGSKEGRITSLRRGGIYIAPIVGGQELNQRFRISKAAINTEGEP
jgi:hypothetical protein